MALVHCPECGNKISERAYICPHCGYSQQAYKLQTGEPGTSIFAIFLKIIAIIFMVSGLFRTIYDIYTGFEQISSFVFIVTYFLQDYSIYFLIGLILWCIATVLNQIKSIYNIVYRLKLITPASQTDINIHSNGKSTGYSQQSDNDRSVGEWQCPKCGKYNTANDQFCTECGTYR